MASHVIRTGLRICLVSDTHELHREIEIPPCDLLIHAGDFSYFSKRPSMLDDFNNWLGEQPVKFGAAITAGNHEFAVEAEPENWRERLSNARLLLNESTEIAGIKIWGSPITSLYGGAFGRANEADRARIFDTIPSDTDILITHGPPLGILDDGQGCGALRRAVTRTKPRLHVFGHIHSAYGTKATVSTFFVNAAAVNAEFEPVNPPVILNFACDDRSERSA